MNPQSVIWSTFSNFVFQDLRNLLALRIIKNNIDVIGTIKCAATGAPDLYKAGSFSLNLSHFPSRAVRWRLRQQETTLTQWLVFCYFL